MSARTALPLESTSPTRILEIMGWLVRRCRFPIEPERWLGRSAIGVAAPADDGDRRVDDPEGPDPEARLVGRRILETELGAFEQRDWVGGVLRLFEKEERPFHAWLPGVQSAEHGEGEAKDDDGTDKRVAHGSMIVDRWFVRESDPPTSLPDRRAGNGNSIFAKTLIPLVSRASGPVRFNRRSEPAVYGFARRTTARKAWPPRRPIQRGIRHWRSALHGIVEPEELAAGLDADSKWTFHRPARGGGVIGLALEPIGKGEGSPVTHFHGCPGPSHSPPSQMLDA